jgi:hypothetical protein
MAAMYCEAINQVPSLECPFWPSTSHPVEIPEQQLSVL